MSSHHDHDNHHSTEPKTVSYRTPMILALVTVVIILLAVSTCDRSHECCEDGKECATEAKHGGHDEHGGHEEHAAEAHEATHATEEHAAPANDAVVAPDTLTKAAEQAHH